MWSVPVYSNCGCIWYNINMKKTKTGIWDYNYKALDLGNPAILKWYLERKISVGDWQSLDQKTIIKYLPKLKINHYVKKVLAFSLAKTNS